MTYVICRVNKCNVNVAIDAATYLNNTQQHACLRHILSMRPRISTTHNLRFCDVSYRCSHVSQQHTTTRVSATYLIDAATDLNNIRANSITDCLWGIKNQKSIKKRKNSCLRYFNTIFCKLRWIYLPCHLITLLTHGFLFYLLSQSTGFSINEFFLVLVSLVTRFSGVTTHPGHVLLLSFSQRANSSLLYFEDPWNLAVFFPNFVVFSFS